MKKTANPTRKRGRPRKNTDAHPQGKAKTADKHPRCARCGSRTVNLERLEQELLVTLSLHCLICGHYTFLGRPVIRLLQRPKVVIPDSITRIAES